MPKLIVTYDEKDDYNEILVYERLRCMPGITNLQILRQKDDVTPIDITDRLIADQTIINGIKVLAGSKYPDSLISEESKRGWNTMVNRLWRILYPTDDKGDCTQSP